MNQGICTVELVRGLFREVELLNLELFSVKLVNVIGWIVKFCTVELLINESDSVKLVWPELANVELVMDELLDKPEFKVALLKVVLGEVKLANIGLCVDELLNKVKLVKVRLLRVGLPTDALLGGDWESTELFAPIDVVPVVSNVATCCPPDVEFRVLPGMPVTRGIVCLGILPLGPAVPPRNTSEGCTLLLDALR